MAVDETSVAIVDDDRAVLNALRRLLTAAGFDVHPYRSGREFLDSSSAGEIDCLLLDVTMPGLDGFSVAEILSDREDHTPVIFMSAHDNASNRQNAKKWGGDFLGKPAHEKRIFTALRRALDPASMPDLGEQNET